MAARVAARWAAVIDIGAVSLWFPSTNVADFDNAGASELAFKVEIPVLNVSSAPIALNGERRIGTGTGRRRKRIVQSQRQAGSEKNMCCQNKSVEIQRFTGANGD